MALTRVCIYTRISTDEENQPTSLHSQRERLEAFCSAQERWRIVAHKQDQATGTKLDRPGLQAALDLARAGSIDLLLVYRVDRLSRKVRQLAQLTEELDTLEVVLKSATEPFDTGSAAGRMMLQMLAVFAEFEHATIVDRISAGIERRAKEGRWYAGRPPFGYAISSEQRLVPDPVKAPIVRRIFDLYTRERLGSVTIAARLRQEQAPAPAAGWGHPAVHFVLSNPTYLGQIRWRDQLFDGIHQPLVDEGTFARAQAILRERGDDLSRRRGNPSAFLLSGLLRCGHCGKAYIGMSAKGNGGTYHYYACSGRQKYGPKACQGERLPRHKLEQAVLHQLTSLYRDSHLISEALAQPKPRPSNNDPRSTSGSPRSAPRSPAPNKPWSATTRPSNRANSHPNAANNASHASKPDSTTSTPNRPNSRQQPTMRPHTRPPPANSLPWPTNSTSSSQRPNHKRRKRCYAC